MEDDPMLVLSRKERESIVVDQRIKITILGVQGSSVRLGIEAPAEVPVHRAEVARRIAQEVTVQAA
jgi:carbon storage regulator